MVVPVHPEDPTLKYPFIHTELIEPEKMVQRLAAEYFTGKFKFKGVASQTPSEATPQLHTLIRGWEYNEIDAIADHFVEDIRIGCRQFGKPNIVDIWLKTPASVLRKLKTPDDVRMFCMKEGRECRLFSTGLALHFMMDYVPGIGLKILDPSAGWGDRMIAAIIAGDKVAEYHGYDPNLALKPRYQDIIDRLDKSKKCIVITEKFQIAQIVKDYYDLAITSPPYFDLEDYSKDADQSIVEFPTWELWIRNFYTKYLLNMRYGVRKGGVLIIYVSNYTVFVDGKKIIRNLEEETVNILTKRASGATLRLKGGLQTKPNDAPRPFFVFDVNE